MKFNDVLKKSFVNTFAAADLSLSEMILIFALIIKIFSCKNPIDKINIQCKNQSNSKNQYHF